MNWDEWRDAAAPGPPWANAGDLASYRVLS